MTRSQHWWDTSAGYCVRSLTTKRRQIVGELKDKSKGVANEVAGNAKQVTGDMTDDQSLSREGEAQERKGEAQNLAGEIKGDLGNKV